MTEQERRLIREKDARWHDTHPQEVFNAYVEEMARTMGITVQRVISLAVVKEKSKLMNVEYTGDMEC